MRRVLPLILFAIVGCSSSTTTTGGGQPGKDGVLFEVGGLIRTASGELGRGPKHVSDFAKYETGYPLGYAAVKSGEVVVVWGAKIAGEGDSATAPADVIAYEKKVATEGGWVLLQNGKTKEMTAEEFKAAPKAK